METYGSTWVSTLANLLIAISAIGSLWIAVNSLRARGKLSGFYEIFARYDGKDWKTVGVRVTLTNLGAKPIIIRTVARKSRAGFETQHHPLTYEMLQMEMPKNPYASFVLRPGDVHVIAVNSRDGEEVNLPLVDPLFAIYLREKSFLGVRTKKMVEAHYELSSLRERGQRLLL